MTNQNSLDHYTAKTIFGLENILAEELKLLGGKNIILGNRAVSFSASLSDLYKMNLASKTALRILKPIKSFNAKSPEQLYRKSQEINWLKYIDTESTFAIDSAVHSLNFTHSKYAALKLKDAIVDQIRDIKGKRPNVDIKDPDIRINLHIENDKCTISLDSSGESLHKRGYRISGFEAPLNEVLAAGLVLLSGWNKISTFIDPMCGSGTIAIEAALSAANKAPNLNRERFGFMSWDNYDSKLFNKVKTELVKGEIKTNTKIYASDKSEKTINHAKKTIQRAGLINEIDLNISDFEKIENKFNVGTIIMNPPYDERIREKDIAELYKKIGDKLKQDFKGFEAWIFSANKEAIKHIGLRPSKKITLFNGALECKFMKFDLYEGSKKKKWDAEK